MNNQANNTSNPQPEPLPIVYSRDGKLVADSRDVAAYFRKNHRDVLKAIRELSCSDDFRQRNFAPFKINDLTGESTSHVEMTRDGFAFLVMGFTGKEAAPFKEGYIAQFNAMETELRERPRAIPDFSDPSVLLGVMQHLQGQVVIAQERALLAERTKAEIGSRREATAMNTASQAVKKVNKLEIDLDRSQQYATIKRMGMLYHGQEFSWRIMRQVSLDMGLPSIDVFDANYGTVKSYHADVWREAYALEIPQSQGQEDAPAPSRRVLIKA